MSSGNEVILGKSRFSKLNSVPSPSQIQVLNDKIAGFLTVSAIFFGAKGDGITDDTTSINKAINDVAGSGGNVLIPYSPNPYLFSVLNIPKGVNLIGINNPVLKSTSLASDNTIVLNGNNILQDLTLDGDNKSKWGVIVTGTASNVRIKGVEVKNLLGDTITGGKGIGVNKGASDVSITNCKFNNINAPENGVQGDSYGASRGILIEECQRITIKECFFDGIGGFEDGDCVHIQSVSTESPTFWTHAYNVLIENNYFVNVKKRAVKVQASGVTVKGNYIESNYIDQTNCPSSGVTLFGSFNTVEDNKIFYKRSVYGIESNQGTGNTISKNYIEVDKAKTYPNARGTSVQNAIYVGSTFDCKILDNTMTAPANGIYSTAQNDRLEIKGNVFLAENGSPINLSNSNGCIISDNIFNGIDGVNPYQVVTIKGTTTDLLISGNLLRMGGMGVRLHGTLNGVNILGNVFSKMVTAKIRTTDVTAGLDTLNVGSGQYNDDKVSSTIPIAGTYTRHDFVIKQDRATELGTAGSKYVVLGWLRLTTGSNHVLNTDWVEIRTLTGN